MNRREVLNKLTLLSGGTLLASSGLLQACHFSAEKRTRLTEKDLPLLDEIGETIIPATATSPGAKAAKIGAYMLVTVKDCFNETQQAAFVDGLDQFDKLCFENYKKPFINLAPSQKKAFLTRLQVEASTSKNKQASAATQSKHYFTVLKDLTVFGYFTSEIGATQARRYQAVPGKYQGCISYKKGDRCWATS